MAKQINCLPYKHKYFSSNLQRKKNPKKLTEQLTLHIHQQRDSVSHKVEGENQHLVFSSDFYTCTVANTYTPAYTVF